MLYIECSICKVSERDELDFELELRWIYGSGWVCVYCTPSEWPKIGQVGKGKSYQEVLK